MTDYPTQLRAAKKRGSAHAGIDPMLFDGAADRIEALEKWKADNEWQDEVLVMICDELEHHDCLCESREMESTPPMMYPEAIRCRIARAHKDAAAHIERLERIERAARHIADSGPSHSALSDLWDALAHPERDATAEEIALAEGGK